jgi:hypothetical protein
MDAGMPATGCDRSWAQWDSTKPSVFMDNKDGTVTDTATGLTWQQGSSPTKLPLTGALAYCQGLPLGGHCDWRLPTRIELGTLVDYTSAGPLMIAQPFSAGTDASGYWTSSSYAAAPGSKGWGVHFGLGIVFPNPVGTALDVRCVR